PRLPPNLGLDRSLTRRSGLRVRRSVGSRHVIGRACRRPCPAGGASVTTRVGINGFGRIGRQSLKAMLERHPDELEVVAVNDLAPTATNAHLFKYDSTYGHPDGEVSSADGVIRIQRHEIRTFRETDPAALPSRDLGVAIGVASAGPFTDGT